jgi:phage terminase large subunit-like protein
MPWQRHVVDVALEVDPDTGLLAYRQVVLGVPRQSGKTTLLLAVMTHRCLGFGEAQHLIFTAQTRNDALDKWRDEHVPALERSALARSIRTVRKSTGSEQVSFVNGSTWGIVAPTEKAGHGRTLDLAVLDEAFAHEDARLEQALKPAQITRPQPQMWIVSTAGKLGRSPYLWGKVEAGRERAELGMTDGIAYFEWSADPDLPPDDPATWRSCMPALGHTISEAAIRADFESTALPEFRRAYLNQWVSDEHDDRPFDMDLWNGLADEHSVPADPVAFAVDVSPDRASACVAVAGLRRDGLEHVEIAASQGGTGWVVDRVAAMCRKWSPVGVAVVPSHAAGALLPDLRAAEVPVVELSGTDYTKACGRFFDAVMDRELRHRGQPLLSAAVDGVRRRPLGDAWLWSRQLASVDISPVVAVTLASWVARTVERPSGPPQIF